MLTSQIIFSITQLILSPSTLHNINKLERAFLWEGTDKIIGTKCEVNWDAVCRPKDLGGLEVLNMGKFARALRLRWLWFEWKHPAKLWVSMGT